VVYQANGLTIETDNLGVAICSIGGIHAYLQGDDSNEWHNQLASGAAQTRGPLSQMSLHEIAAYISADYVY
jgi:hypothetical protein